uniref:Uncharacterized protein n=1 Tax=viral metagenome TaxID=1070528 RepID=A0A6M3J4W9_9ZZZZ
MNWTRKLKLMNACKEAVKWCENYDSPEEAWQACEQGHWMLWLLGKLSGGPETDSRKKLVLATCGCARLALTYVKEGEIRPLKAIETAEAWGRDESGVTLSDVRAAANAAADAVYAANAAYAAYFAASAAYYAANAADAAVYAAYATDAAYDAADAAANGKKKSILKQCADIVRQHYPHAPHFKRGMNAKHKG